MFGVCLLVVCLGQRPLASERLTFSHDVRGETRTERIVSYERRWVIAGFVQQQGAPDAAFGGALPLHVNFFNGYITLDGGVIVATADVPGTGTRGNFMTRVQFQLSKRVAVTYWHWSNAGLSDRNPEVDVLGASVRLRVDGHHGDRHTSTIK
jgi:Lipid A 3-O-deacylase (PagL)